MNPFHYPATITRDAAGFYLVTFPDVPEAGTDAQTREEALHDAGDALIAALGGYVQARRPIPRPSKAKPRQVLITLPTLVTAKLAQTEEKSLGLGAPPESLREGHSTRSQCNSTHAMGKAATGDYTMASASPR